MGYPGELDEISEARLVHELIRRMTQRQEGNCDYCERRVMSDPVCTFPHRHNMVNQIDLRTGDLVFVVGSNEEADGVRQALGTLDPLLVVTK